MANLSAQSRSSALSWLPASGLLASLAALVLILVICKLAGETSMSPGSLTVDVATPVDAFADWISETFRFLLKPSSDVMKATLKDIDRFVLGLPWLVPFVVLTLVSLSLGRLASCAAVRGNSALHRQRRALEIKPRHAQHHGALGRAYGPHGHSPGHLGGQGSDRLEAGMVPCSTPCRPCLPLSISFRSCCCLASVASLRSSPPSSMPRRDRHAHTYPRSHGLARPPSRTRPQGAETRPLRVLQRDRAAGLSAAPHPGPRTCQRAF